MWLIILLLVGFIALMLWIASANNSNKELLEKKFDLDNKIIQIELQRIEKYIPEGVVPSDVIELIQKAKSNGLGYIEYPQGAYDKIVSESLNVYFAKKERKTSSEPDLVKCPKCRSTQLTAEKNGFSAGKALAGAFVTGGIGLLAGFHGSKNLKVYCINCGHKWTPSK